jgi:hypothetical protein
MIRKNNVRSLGSNGSVIVGLLVELRQQAFRLASVGIDGDRPASQSNQSI